MIHRLFSEPLTPSNSVALDLSVSNAELNPSVYSNIETFGAYIEQKLGARIGIGGYLEHRIIYEAHENFATSGTDFRNIHLGIDFWTTAGTPVFSVADGVVHSFQVNSGSGNYGPTIILHHPHLDIYSLYGHLAFQDLDVLSVGMPIAEGQLICHLGEQDENGGWPPHLHFQLIRDMQGFQGDYPGVCSQRDLAFYAENCPDPATFDTPT
jgi:murein DD-endopeptidase MepM/ murein hydrolase activator NlpD